MPRRTDEIGFGGCRLIQDTDSFCYGVDAVLLADFAVVSTADRVLDLGCGNGVVPVILNAKYSPKLIRGLEIQPRAAALAKENMQLNGIEDKAEIICGDVMNICDYFEAESFNAVTCNPPYFQGGRGISCRDNSKHISRHETTAGIADFVSAAAKVLVKGGRFYLVHRPSRLCDIIKACTDVNLEPKLMRSVVPRKGEAANIVLIMCVKGGGRELMVLPELAVREGNGYTEELKSIYDSWAGKQL